MYEKQTVTLDECRIILANNGFPIGNEKLAEGIRQGVFSEFARVIDMRKNGRGRFEYVIFKKDLAEFIRAHTGGAASA